MSEIHDGRVLERVPLDRIMPGPNVRTEFGDLEGLAASIREHGVLTPLLLRRLNGDDSYELIAGGGRYRAAVLAGVADVPAQVETPEALDSVAEVRRVAEQLAENGHRLDLTPAEEMHGVQQLLGLGLTDEDVATQTGNEPAQVAAMRRVLALPEAARTLIDEGALSLTAAAELAATEDEEIVARALTLIDEGYSPDSAARHAQTEITRRRVLEDAHARLAKAGVPEIDPPTYGYSFGGKSKKRVLGKGYECLHVPLKQHRRMACHAAYINRYAQSTKDAIVWVCVDVSRHANDPDAGVPKELLRAPEAVKEERAERRRQKKAWRESHTTRRAFARQLLGELDQDAAIARLAGELFPADGGEARVAAIAAALLGHPCDEDAASLWLDERWRAAAPAEQLRIAVAWLTARAEVAMTKEHGDWREHENVRAHFALLSSRGYPTGEEKRRTWSAPSNSTVWSVLPSGRRCATPGSTVPAPGSRRRRKAKRPKQATRTSRRSSLRQPVPMWSRWPLRASRRVGEGGRGERSPCHPTAGAVRLTTDGAALGCACWPVSCAWAGRSLDVAVEQRAPAGSRVDGRNPTTRCACVPMRLQ